MQMEELTQLGIPEQAAKAVLELAGRDEAQSLERVQALERRAAVERALFEGGAIDPRTVLPLLDLERVEWEDGDPRGLREQIDRARRSAGYLFGRGAAPRMDSGLSHGASPAASGPRTLGGALREHYR